MKIKICAILLFISLSIISTAQQKFSKDLLIADIDTLYTAIEETHPDMFAVYAREDFEKELNEIKNSLTDSMTLLEFYQRVTPAVVHLGDGHTRVNFPVKSLQEVNAKLFPYSIKINKKDYSIVIDKDLADDQSNIPLQSKLISINGKNTKSLVEELLEYESGESLNFRLSMLEAKLIPYLYMLYGEEPLTVEYINKNGKLQKETIEGIPYSIIAEKSRERQSNNNSYFSLTINDDNVAVIDFKSFSDLNGFKSFLDSTFTLIKERNIKDLIIDIRNNGGGNSVLGDELFQYISPVPFAQFGNTHIKVSDRLRRRSGNIEQPNGIIKFENNPLIELRDNGLRYAGNTYLLTSSNTFSSATDFAWAFHYFKMGTIIGEETGGWIVCFGDVLNQNLPNTGLSFGVSYKRFYGYGATDKHTHGVIPDYEVPAEEAMDVALKLIGQKSE